MKRQNTHRLHSRFDLFKRNPDGQKTLICSDLTFTQAVSLVSEIPDSVVKFSRMEAAR